MDDPTEDFRRKMVHQLNVEPGSREDLAIKWGQVWDTAEMQKDFEAISFFAPYINVRRRADGVKGTLTFQHSPRFYFDFKPL